MRRLSGLCLLVLLAVASASRADDAVAARAARIRKMLERSPDSGGLLWHLARAEAQLGNAEESARLVGRVLDQGLDVELSDAAFDPVRTTPAFARLSKKAAARRTPGGKSEVLFRIADRDLIPEGIAYDPVDDAYYVSSLHQRKIVRVGKDRVARDFTRPAQDGLQEVLGLRVLPSRRLLFAASASGNGPDAGTAGLFVYDLRTGTLVKKVVLDTQPPKHLLNDVAVRANGEVFVTDSEAGAVWRLRPLASALEPLVPAGTFDYPNGIALSPDGAALFVADGAKGISRVDMETGSVRPLAHPPDVSLDGVDGLYADRDGLVAVQNGIPVPRVARFTLSKERDRVLAAKVLESRHPLFAIPTTAAPAGDFLALLAATHLDALDANSVLKKDAPRGDVVVLKVPLR